MFCPKEGCDGVLAFRRIEPAEGEDVDVMFVCGSDEEHRFFTRIHPDDLIEEG